MEIIKTSFAGLYIFKKKLHKDKRGHFCETFKQNFFLENFVFDCFSFSRKNVIRGLHFQLKHQQAKYISVFKGKILDVCLDLRKDSRTFGKIFKIILSDKNGLSLFVPKGFAHGFYSFYNENLVYYKTTNYRNQKSEKGILWNDADLKINWPTKKPILSSKDKKNITYKTFLKKYKYI